MRELGLPEMLVIVPVFVLIPLAALFVVFSIHRLRNKERLLAIEKGVALPVAPRDPVERARNLRKSALILIALGLGLFVLMLTTADSARLGIGVGAVPFLLGWALLVEYGLLLRDLKQ